MYRTLVISLFCFLSCRAENKNNPDSSGAATELRVVGYLFSRGDWMARYEDFNLSDVTDINVAFVNPNTDGKMPVLQTFTDIVNKAHAGKVNAYFSIGGGEHLPHLEKLIDATHRKSFIAELISFMERYGFDGIDVDLENDLVNDDYPGFVGELGAAVRAKKKKMTAAIASWNADKIPDETLMQYDFINVMSYDKTGPWNLARPGQHSPMSMVVDDWMYFTLVRKIPASRLIIGLPFYGYGFGAGAPESLNYGQIVTQYGGAAGKDTVVFTEGGTLYYNGMSTIREKTTFAKNNQAAGVMIWQLSGDAKGEFSLLSVINKVAGRR